MPLFYRFNDLTAFIKLSGFSGGFIRDAFTIFAQTSIEKCSTYLRYSKAAGQIVRKNIYILTVLLLDLISHLKKTIKITRVFRQFVAG